MSPRRVIVPLFEIASNPTVRLTDIKSRFRMVPRRCPVCRETVDDLSEHLSFMEDDGHVVRGIMDL